MTIKRPAQSMRSWKLPRWSVVDAAATALATNLASTVGAALMIPTIVSLTVLAMISIPSNALGQPSTAPPAMAPTATAEEPPGGTVATPESRASANRPERDAANADDGRAPTSQAGPPGTREPGATTQTPARRPAPAPSLRRAPLSASERQLLDEIERDFARYQDAAKAHEARMVTILRRAYTTQQKRLEARYDTHLRHAEEQKTQSHLDTIALLQAFIKKHPNHGQFTPDAMFRLADLYLDESEAELEAIEERADPDVDPVADYSRSITLWQQILDRFPQYRQLPGTVYLLAHYSKIQDERRSLKLFLSLVCANQHRHTEPAPPAPNRAVASARARRRTMSNPYGECSPMAGADGELIQHAWVRGVGDLHFMVPGELDQAIAAYNRVADSPQAGLYAESLYKLAWSYYRRDFMLESIQYFDQSLVTYDAAVARGETPKLELRDESLQYIAVAFTDPWNGELDTDPAVSLQRAQAFYRGQEGEAHVRDVWEVLGYAFVEIQAYDQAIAALSKALDPPWHLHRNNPLVHQEIVNAYEAKGDKLAADEAAGQLAARYGPGSQWYIANEKDREAMANQRRIGERMLYAAARNLHAAATAQRETYETAGIVDPVARGQYLELYGKAVDLYRSFLEQYPESLQTYELTFALAEALYFSGRYLESVPHYRWVRDHRELSESHFEEAAYSVIQALEAEANRLVAAGVIEDIRVPTAEELRALPQPVQAQAMPDIYRRLQQEWDKYQELSPDPKTAPQMGLNAALVAIAYYDLDDAVMRLGKVVDGFCGTAEAARAKDGLLTIYEARGQADAFKATNDKFIAAKCGDSETLALAKAQNRSIEFRRAGYLFSGQQYGEAAKAFYTYYKSSPADDADAPTALYNAAISYRAAGRPKTAIHLLREFTNNRAPAYRKSGYYLEALRFTAIAYHGMFDYDRAVAAYLELYDQAGTAKARGLTLPPPPPGESAKTFAEVRLDALYNAALLRELDRDFKSAVDLYRRYEREERDRRRKDRALWAIARIHRASGNIGSMISAYDNWRRQYGNDAGNEDDYVFSFYDVAEAYAKRKRTPQADDYRRKTIAAWEKKGAQKRTRGAELAGECALYFAESHYRKTFMPLRIRRAARTEKQALAQRKSLDAKTKDMQQQFLALGRFGVGEYAMAAKVRYGETLTLYAQKVFEMPTPQYVLNLDRRNPDLGLVAQFEETVTQTLAPLAEEAKKEWREVVDMAKQQGVSNRWSKLALENLNREFPDEYPILHDELASGTEEPS